MSRKNSSNNNPGQIITADGGADRDTAVEVSGNFDDSLGEGKYWHLRCEGNFDARDCHYLIFSDHMPFLEGMVLLGMYTRG